jgi:hypothetical protein
VTSRPAPVRHVSAVSSRAVSEPVAAPTEAPAPASTIADPPAIDLRFRSPWQRGWDKLWVADPGVTFALTRFLILRLFGLVSLMAFATWVNQGPALVGQHGLLPAALRFARRADELGGRTAAFFETPSLFWISNSDRFMFGCGWLAVALSAAVLAGYANALMLLALWALQLSIVSAGQTFYAFGWESQLAETAFLCAFLCPLLDGRPFPRLGPPRIVIWLFRWLIFRIMLGAGLIKLRGDPCWRDLTCLDFHFETQPLLNPLSPLFHALPHGVHKAGTLFNHLVELIAPFFIVAPRRWRHAGGLAMLALQLVLIASGNLSFLNWLTIVPIIACFDDRFLARLVPARLATTATRACAMATSSRGQRGAVAALALVVAWLSVEPTLNLLSPDQAMNAAFDRLRLVNTYGAFGSVGRVRNEIIFEATADRVITPATRWSAYEFKCKPGDPARWPCLMSPYHYRLDWLIWFAAMGEPTQFPWAIHFVWKLLEADPAVLDLLAHAPLGRQKPGHVRATLYRYTLAPLGSREVWQRAELGPWLPPLSRDEPGLRAFIEGHGWLPTTAPSAASLREKGLEPLVQRRLDHGEGARRR